MSPEETSRLVNWIISTWPMGVRGNVWTDALEPLEYDAALATYRRLRDTAERCTVAAFMQTYRARLTAIKSPPAQPALPLHGDPWLAWDDPRAIRAFNRGLTLGEQDRQRDEAGRRERERTEAELHTNRTHRMWDEVRRPT